MQVTPPSRIVMVCREEKEAALYQFLLQGLESGSEAVSFTLVARNAESPAARALVKAASEAQFSRVTFRAIVLEADATQSALPGAQLTEGENIDVRIIKDARFVSAHEQLVCGPARVWIGDCMRREPVKRDAFELYHAENATAATFAEASFERLWLKAKAFKPALNTLVPGLVAASQTAVKSAARPATNG